MVQEPISEFKGLRCKNFGRTEGIIKFKDCKSGGYSLEGCHATEQRLNAIVLLIAIAYTSAIVQGIGIRTA